MPRRIYAHFELHRVFIQTSIILLMWSNWCLAVEHKQAKHVRVRALVAQLKSPNKAPSHTLPATYDRGAQLLVFLAVHELLNEGDTAFDDLIEQLNDPNYCLTCETPSGLRNFTVGDICYKIIRRGIYSYEDPGRVTLLSSSQRHISPNHAPSEIKRWWADNRQTPLWKHQINAINAQIALMRQLKYETSPSPYPFADKLPKLTFENCLVENISKLEALKSSLIQLKEAYRPRSLDDDFSMMTGLPWSTTNWGK